VATPFKIFSLGDSAITLDLGNVIDIRLNQRALAIQQHLLKNPFAGLKDCWVAYSSITLVFDPLEVKKVYNPEKTVYSLLSTWLQNAYEEAADLIPTNGRTIRIPVCYEGEYAMDLHDLAEKKQLTPETIIDLHTSRSYRVYMIGFLPGFSYMAEVDERLIISRKPQPVTVMPGSVGITGSQTGIYPLQCPGGWFIIGRTPYQLFNSKAESPVLLQAGDTVQFYPISSEEFEAFKKS
jgi:inhibitor of KinA